VGEEEAGHRVSKRRTSKINGRLLQEWRKKKIFAARRKLKRTAKILPCVSKRRTSKTNGCLLQEWRKKKIFAVRRYLKRTAP
jgi:hypothetical protein